MKIGIFLAYGPQTHLDREGLGRYIGGLVKGFSDANEQVTLLLPKWSVDTVMDLLSEFGVPECAVQFAVLDRLPVLWGVHLFFKRHKKRKTRERYRVLRTAVDCLEIAAAFFVNITNSVIFTLLAAVLLLTALLCLPIALLGALLYAVVHFVKSRAHKQKPSLYQKVLSITEAFSKSGKNIYAFAYEKMMNGVTKMLVEKANRQDVDVWFVPALFWPETKALRKTRVITAPDLVTRQFPALCASDESFADATERCSKTITDGTYFITYSDYIKESLLQRQFGKEYIAVIRHADNALHTLISIDPEIERKLNATKNLTGAFARELLGTLPQRINYSEAYMSWFSFQSIRYIFYASQARPYKNLLSLVRAYEALLRDRFVDVKLILTCDLRRDPAAYQYVYEKRLQFDVLCFCGVSAQQLAALYHCAELVVNPTLYEGGFPFTFGEGMSVGTPSVMSDIPQVREVVERFGLEEDMLFDPYDWKAMADKIEYALQNRGALYQKELPLYKELEKRTGSVVAEEYVHAFEYFMEQDKLAQNS